MNRLLYQLSYAAMGMPKIGFVIISTDFLFVKRFSLHFSDFFGKPIREVRKHGDLETGNAILYRRL